MIFYLLKVSSKLKKTEILYTLCLARAHKGKDHMTLASFTSLYTKLVDSRRALALFQHHDAITGEKIRIIS